MAPGLCALEHLTSLSLCPSTESSLCGSIEHAPKLKRLKLTSTSRSSLLHSKTLTSLTIGSHNVRPSATSLPAHPPSHSRLHRANGFPEQHVLGEVLTRERPSCQCTALAACIAEHAKGMWL